MGEIKEPWWSRQIKILIQNFFTIGAALAVVQSWEKFHSVKFSAWCGLGNWLYVLMPSVYDAMMR